MTMPGPGDSATWPQVIGPRDPRYDDSKDIAVDDAMSSLDDIQEQLDRAETALSVRAWDAYREAVSKAQELIGSLP